VGSAPNPVLIFWFRALSSGPTDPFLPFFTLLCKTTDHIHLVSFFPLVQLLKELGSLHLYRLSVTLRLDECIDILRRLSLARSSEVSSFSLCFELATLTRSSQGPLTMLNNTSSDFDLTIRQQPNRARVAGGKEKGM
jgi:hypothetical protein